MQIYCGPKSYLYNKTLCIRDPKYYNVVNKYTQFCNPNVRANKLGKIITPIALQSICRLDTRYHQQYDCCYSDFYNPYAFEV